jgi:outer membrane protein OmpA-like peptidoglycan-associated protein
MVPAKPAPVAAAAAATAAASAAVKSASTPMAASVAPVVAESSGTGIATLLGLAIPLAIFAALIWYWAYGLDGGRSAISAAKTAAAPAAVAPAAKPAAPAPTPAPAPAPEVKKVESAPPAPAPVAAPVAVPSANGMVKYTLPGGAAIDVGKDGVESKLLGFITNKDAAIDKKLWFNFDRLSFDTGSTSLTADSKAQIGTVAAILKAYPAVAVKIGGYTDNQGDPEANMKLSTARAKKVMEEIVGSGIAADRVESEGYGEQFPVGDNATPEGRAQNRRTSLSVRLK